MRRRVCIVLEIQWLVLVRQLCPNKWAQPPFTRVRLSTASRVHPFQQRSQNGSAFFFSQALGSCWASAASWFGCSGAALLQRGVYDLVTLRVKTGPGSLNYSSTNAVTIQLLFHIYHPFISIYKVKINLILEVQKNIRCFQTFDGQCRLYTGFTTCFSN